MFSCDTVVALPNSTKDGRLIFAKNSDRHPNEAQSVVFFPRKTYPLGSKVKCTYIEVPQVTETNAVILSKPFWMWGAEMGVNEFNVAIGNEAIFTKGQDTNKIALMGMDLLRLTLERAKNANEALEILTSLLEEHGQGQLLVDLIAILYY